VDRILVDENLRDFDVNTGVTDDVSRCDDDSKAQHRPRAHRLYSVQAGCINRRKKKKTL